MKKRTTQTTAIIISIIVILAYLSVRDNTTIVDKSHSSLDHSIVPEPLKVKQGKGVLLLGDKSTIYFDNEILMPLSEKLSDDIYLLSGKRINLSTAKNKWADIRISLNDKLGLEEYKLTIDNNVAIIAGSSKGAVWGVVTLLQLMEQQGNTIQIPRITIQDSPRSEYRGLLLDVARQWHSIDHVKQIVELCRWYKINYLHLHLTDDQSFTFPSSHFPELATPNRHYSKEELKKLVEYAENRGVIIIPELDLPGHSSLMQKVAPFGREGIHVINMLDESVYEALEKLVGEMCEVFYTSPYFHMGGDESWLKGVGETTEDKAFMEEHHLETVEDVYNFFIVRMNDIIKSNNKRTLVWEGFKGKGSENVSIPDDLIVFAWESLYQRPDSLLANGYTIINASWQPLYIVPHRMWQQEYIYNWNMFRFENWWEITPAFTPIQVEPTDQIIGAQMCAWENKQDNELQAISLRLPAMSERIWNPDFDKEYSDFERRFKVQDRKFSIIIDQ